MVVSIPAIYYSYGLSQAPLRLPDSQSGIVHVYRTLVYAALSGPHPKPPRVLM